MVRTQTQQAQTQQTNKAANNTPVAPFAAYLAKITDAKMRKAIKEAGDKAQQEKREKSKRNAANPFALVAGAVARITHKGLTKAIGYHVAKGNLMRTKDGIALTAQGAKLWNVERVAGNMDTFQKIAAFVNGAANLPEFGGERKTPCKVADNKQLPSMEYWGSFATMNMRLAFASLWATK